ncbi:VWA domain-containing protein [Hoyosella rhizosphaerae]|uniref:VWFA domain-containing protein n=1 Tax=Hoyosella rhizosphaerae TaxID=1755582 RepID=A0A916UJ91_9ACTN|nr:VWA domain-containing protein [Hoyosella rhizosphaerae]MBN4925456.1 VWA domain-containing protein [Hoyosella rhizosphaerae]GGC75052.1 hypothetical protein GCM10011410_30440 [Hoyosella rhizosphaerae]
MAAIEPEPQELVVADDWALCETWVRGGQYGLLLVGDSWGREQLWRELAERCRRSHTSADLFPAADLAQIDFTTISDRVLASAPEFESVPRALAAKLTCVIGVRVRPQTKPARVSASGFPQHDCVRALAANGIHDHTIDIGAARMVTSIIRESGNTHAALEALYRTVVAPRVHFLSTDDSADISPMSQESADDEESPSTGESGESEATDADETTQQGSDSSDSTAHDGSGESGGAEFDSGEISDMDEEAADYETEHAAAISDEFATTILPTPPTQRLRGLVIRSAVRRGIRINGDRGRAGRVVSIERAHGVVAVLPTLVAAARRRASTVADQQLIHRSDLRGVLRRSRAKTLTVVIVDRSDSMGRLRIKQATDIATQALGQAYLDRSEVAIISARGSKASLVLPPTRGIRRAHSMLASLPSGGGTPLASAFELTRMVCLPYTTRKNTQVNIVVATDGSTNVKLSNDLPGDAVSQAREQLGLLTQMASVAVLPLRHTGMRVTDDQLAWLTDSGATVMS